MCKKHASTEILSSFKKNFCYDEKCGTVTKNESIKHLILKQVTKVYQIKYAIALFFKIWF